jgi:maltooligosyltrehalose trehalohydrolase
VVVNLADAPRRVDLGTTATGVIFATADEPELGGTTVTMPPESAAILRTS